MRTVLCYGDSNTWGCGAAQPEGPPGRYAPDVRWPGVLARELGAGFRVVEEGLPGRTTAFDDPDEPHRNGADYLPPCLRSHAPLDLVVLMLGTNDVKGRIAATPEDVAAGAARLVDLVRESGCGTGGGAPDVLLVCPAPVTLDEGEYAGGRAKALALPPLYAELAAAYGCAFLDAGTAIEVDPLDGVHLTPEAHAKLGRVVVERVRELLGGLGAS